MIYLGYYNLDGISKQKRYVAPAGMNKMTYICSAFNSIGTNIEIVSASMPNNNTNCAGTVFSVFDKTTCRLFPCLGNGNLFKKAIRKALFNTKLFYYLYRNIKKNSTVLAYHSLGYVKLLTFLKKVKPFRLILEVEEIYADVNGNKKDRINEMRLFSIADAFIFPTNLLNQTINHSNKPYVIVHGTYQAEDELASPFNDHKIHCVYAGTFDHRKGALAVVSAAENLDENYHVHIVGFGTESEKEKLLSKIKEVSQKTACTITYDGLLSGMEYNKFLQCCHIGLSTQNPDAQFNNTSFPSKILSYMANNLRVVSIRIPAIESSAIADYIEFYEEQTPQSIAEAIKKIDISKPYNSKDILNRLHEQFQQDLRKMQRTCI